MPAIIEQLDGLTIDYLVEKDERYMIQVNPISDDQSSALRSELKDLFREYRVATVKYERDDSEHDILVVGQEILKVRYSNSDTNIYIVHVSAYLPDYLYEDAKVIKR